MIAVGRAIAGVAVGLMSGIVPMYCAEIATAQDRGKLSGLLQFMLSWGFFVAQWLGFGCFHVDSDFQCKRCLAEMGQMIVLTFYDRAVSACVPGSTWPNHGRWNMVYA